MNRPRKTFAIVLIILNAVVLLGQLWPEGAPPFAHIVNVLTLLLNIVFLVMLVTNRK